MAINYEVKQGDCVYSIAFEHGFFADTIWNHPNNAELKKRRKEPHVLLPGDAVFVPDLRLKEVSRPTNEVHKFRCKNTPKTMRIQLLCIDDTPVADLGYTVDIDGVGKEGKTDSEGWITLSILPNASTAKLVFDDGSTYELKLGNIDPVDEVTGVQGRLQSLGYYEGPVDGQMNDESREALKMFQRSHDLDDTGEADEKTKNLLIQMAGK